LSANRYTNHDVHMCLKMGRALGLLANEFTIKYKIIMRILHKVYMTILPLPKMWR